VAHRLYLTEGKCENIHGHSMKVKLEIFGTVDDKGILNGLNFTDVKKEFRGFLDGMFDHHLLLNNKDPWAQKAIINDIYNYLPGLQTFPGDPTTENIAEYIKDWADGEFKGHCEVEVWETDVNMARTF
jgi:6-pyruvoyl-tetrahydropterin synthase